MDLKKGNSTQNYLLKDKYNADAEVEMILFNWCNLYCNFCSQDHDSIVGMTSEEVYQKIWITKDFLDKSPSECISFSMMGGELFADEVPDEMFEAYYQLAMASTEHCTKLGKKAKWTWVSNFAYNNTDRVIRFLDKLKARGLETYISTSYDFTGRPLDKAKRSQFHINLIAFKDYMRMVGMVMTKPTIDFIIKRKDPYFDEYIYPNFHVHFDYYVPEHLPAADKLMPSDQDQLDVYLHLLEHYPKADPVKGWLEDRGDIRTMSCMCSGPYRKITILPDGKTSVCRYRENYGDDFFIEKVDLKDMSNIVKSYMKRNDCLTCEYFNKCEFTCFVQSDYKYKERNDICIYKIINKKLEELRGDT